MGISKWNAGIIRPVPVAPTGAYADSSAPGVWTLDQQAYWQKQGLWPTQGNVNPDVFIENLFSTYLYTGTSGSNTITNGIDLSTKGGLVWVKSRSGASSGSNHILQDTVRGANKQLRSNTTGAEGSDAVNWAFNSSGFSMNTSISFLNDSGTNYASWTFREQPKFFDVVTWTGNGSATQTISHNLGSAPGCIMVKLTSGSNGWDVYHRSLGTSAYVQLNTTSASTTISNVWGTINSTTFTATGTLGQNDPGATYVAYLFAHNAGGFGLTGTDNVISCGSWVNTGSNVTVNLGYEPQYIMMKASGTTSDWYVWDTMRGLVVDGNSGTGDKALYPNLSSAEVGTFGIEPTATGFIASGGWTSTTWIYIAIRRGPMKVPTLGTSVFAPITYTGDGAASRVITTGIKTDLIIGGDRGSNAIGPGYTNDRLRGQVLLNTTVNDAETANAAYPTFAVMDGYTNLATGGAFNATGFSYIRWAFQRAPGFFDEVCYTGTGSAQNVTHNLTVAPELVIIKSRSGGGGGYDWVIGSSTLPSWGRYLLFATDAVNGSNNAGPFNNTAPTSSVLTVNTWTETNGSGSTYVAYLFATCPGVSKVGSYTGTGALQTVACGFTSGARFVLIKRTDSTGDWYVWDSARGITSGNDPYLLLNSTAAEVTGTNYVDTDTTGFKVTAAAPAGINASGGTYIFLAIA